MSGNECRCGRPTRDVAYLCETCCEELKVALGDVPELEEELTITITRQRGKAAEGSGAASASCSCKDDDDDCQHALIPWHDKAAEVQRHLRSMLVLWVKFCSEERVRHRTRSLAHGPTHERCGHASCESIARGDFPADTLASMSAWLLWRVDGLALRDIGPDAYDEITNAVANCRRIIDRRPDRWYAGPCDCGKDLYATSREGFVDCRGCGLRWDVGKRRDWLLAEAEDRLANAATVARAVSWLGAEPLTAARVRKWAERGQILAKGHDGRSPLYRVGDAIDLLARTTTERIAG